MAAVVISPVVVMVAGGFPSVVAGPVAAAVEAGPAVVVDSEVSVAEAAVAAELQAPGSGLDDSLERIYLSLLYIKKEPANRRLFLYIQEGLRPPLYWSVEIPVLKFLLS